MTDARKCALIIECVQLSMIAAETAMREARDAAERKWGAAWLQDLEQLLAELRDTKANL